MESTPGEGSKSQPCLIAVAMRSLVRCAAAWGRVMTPCELAASSVTAAIARSGMSTTVRRGYLTVLAAGSAAPEPGGCEPSTRIWRRTPHTTTPVVKAAPRCELQPAGSGS